MTTYVPKKTRDDVYKYLFTEGTMVCEKNRLGHWMGELAGTKFRVPNLHVMQLMKSMKSRGLIREQFAWRHFYWFLNDQGVDHLRKYLHLEAAVVPDTHKAQAGESFERGPRDGRGGGRGRGEGRGRGRGEGRGRGRGGFGEERAGYGRSAEGAEGEGFRGRGRGMGRGRGRGFGRGRGGDAAPAGEAAAPAQE